MAKTEITPEVKAKVEEKIKAVAMAMLAVMDYVAAVKDESGVDLWVPLAKDYPFKSSFDEMTVSVFDWKDIFSREA